MNVLHFNNKHYENERYFDIITILNFKTGVYFNLI